MKIGIAGAGAVGCHYGSLLQRAGCDVVYFARGEHVKALKTHGLKHESNGERVCLSVFASDEISSLSECDVIFLSCKTTSLTVLCEQLLPVIKTNSTLLTLQNGVSSPDKVAQFFLTHTVIAASAFIGVRIETPGLVIHSAAGHLRFGRWQGESDATLSFLEKKWQQSGIDAQIVNDMQMMLWHKMLWNCGFNAMTALTHRYARDVAANPEMVGWVRDAMLETIHVARHVGVILPKDAIEQHIQLTMDAGAVKTSMWQDIERGRRTEIDEMNGYITHLADQYNVETPVNALLTSLIRSSSKVG
ncbi:MAG: ketopantoate reductase family protein [Mariprofundaceae bacterium]